MLLAILLMTLGVLSAAFVVLLLEPIRGERERGRQRIRGWRRDSLGLI